MRYDEMVFVTGLRVKAITVLEGSGFVDLVPDTPNGSWTGVLRWECPKDSVLLNARINDRLAVLADAELFEARST